MFVLAGAAMDSLNFANYWMFKILFATVAVTLGMGVSTILEECFVARLGRKNYGELTFFTPVIRANYVTLGLVLLVAAAETLPKRLHSPHFLAALAQALRAWVGSG